MFTPGPDAGGLDVGTFETTGQDLAITADLTCGLNLTGSMAVVPAQLPPTDAAEPEASSAGWQLTGIASALPALWALAGALWLRRARAGRVRPEAQDRRSTDG